MLKKIAKKILGDDTIRYYKSFFPSTEEKKIQEQRRKFYSQFLKKGDIYFDVGSNYGNRIEPIKDLGINIVAVEPQEKCIKYLRKKYGSTINLVTNGLGEREEDRELFIASADTVSSFSAEWIATMKESGRFGDTDWSKKSLVHITTLDNLITRFGNPDFIKIDVEGFELEVLKGLTTPQKMISFEYAVPEASAAVMACIERLGVISDKKIYFNYSIEESMSWALSEWLSYEAFIEKVKTEEFIASGFGDIYVNYRP